MKNNILTDKGKNLIEQGYTKAQVREIEEGLAQKLDISIYADKSFMALQMRQIRLGLMENLPIEKYASIEYDWFQMEEIRKGLLNGVDVNVYASKDIPYDKMREIRRGLEEDIDMLQYMMYPANMMTQIRKSLELRIDIIPYIEAGYDIEQIEVIREAHHKQIKIEEYVTTDFIGPAIREIMLGLEAMQNVKLYARPDYTWQQMREVRLGLKNRIDVDVYNDSFYNWKQMRQIRLGLETGLDVTRYSSYMYTAKEMSKIRNRMLLVDDGKNEMYIEESDDIVIRISADEMKAQVKILHAGRHYTRDDIVLELAEHGICEGINEGSIKRLITHQGDDEYVTIAKGIAPVDGRDGWYEFYFDIENKRQQKLLPDGSVDYQQQEWYQSTKANEKIAYYHEATAGTNGKTVTGKELLSKKGKEKASLLLEGCTLLEDNKTYIADTAGRVELKGDKLIVKDILELEEVTLSTGNVDFEGNVYIKGNVGSGTVIKAAGDIVIGGYVEAATIIADGDIEIRLGVNAPEKGYIEAKGNIAGKYFENAYVKAHKNLSANYILNSETYCYGEITIDGSRGTITGGKTYARKGLKSNNLGNAMRMTTRVDVGVNEEMLDELQAIVVKIRNIKKELHVLKQAYEEINNKYSVVEKNGLDVYKKVEKSILAYENRLTNLVYEKENLEGIIEETKKSKIEVKGVLYEGVRIDINGSQWNSDELTNVIIENKHMNVEVNKGKK